MSDIIDFFLNPYKGIEGYFIFLEAIAVISGIVSVVYAQRERILVYPTGILSTVIFIYIAWRSVLYGDFVIYMYYTAMSIYGWIRWTNSEQKLDLPITKMNKNDMWKSTGIFLSTLLLVIAIYVWTNRYSELTSYLDTLTTAIFFSGMWLMANKKIEHWWFWIVGNTISIPLYWVKGLGLTSLQYIVFLFLAVQGYVMWKRQLKMKDFQYESQKI